MLWAPAYKEFDCNELKIQLQRTPAKNEQFPLDWY